MTREKARQLASALVERMTLDEKASQLTYFSPAIPRLNVPAYNWWNEVLHGVARAGTATVFPQAIGMAAAFDDTLMQTIADTISTEARAKYNMQSANGDRDIYKGLTAWSPNINIFRDPRWGRGQETYGEDPYLTSRLGVAFVRACREMVIRLRSRHVLNTTLCTRAPRPGGTASTLLSTRKICTKLTCPHSRHW
jgi:beta-glucosidase